MNETKKKLLLNYMSINIAPVLVENINIEAFKKAVVLESNCDSSLLNGHYEGVEFVAPSWYQDLVNVKSKPILIIKDINAIDISQQTKFIEILKYKKISTFDLPSNCNIIVTCSDLNNKPINEEVYSLLAHI